ncbi:MAG: hypothetical protein WCI74_11675, partial [Actinomycetes bacterium]
TKPFKATTAKLRNINGVLVFDNAIEPGMQVLAPTSTRTAFTFGLGGGLGRDKGDVVFAGQTRSGNQTLTYLGVRFVKVR